MPNLLTKRDYKKLLTDLQRIIREGKQEAERAATQALIESYWSIGKRIAKEKLNTPRAQAESRNCAVLDVMSPGTPRGPNLS